MNHTTTTINALPQTGFLREPDLVGLKPVSPEEAEANRKRGKGPKRSRAGRQGLLPFSDSTLWRLIQRQQFPAPVRLADRVSAWSVESVREWIAARSADSAK